MSEQKDPQTRTWLRRAQCPGGEVEPHLHQMTNEIIKEIRADGTTQFALLEVRVIGYRVPRESSIQNESDHP
jgi:hypothetical protein